jgi:O-antigen ligase
MKPIGEYPSAGSHTGQTRQGSIRLAGTGSAETRVPSAPVAKRSGGFMRLGLREIASAVLAASIAGLVWLPNVPSIASAVFASIVVCTLVVELVRGQEKLVIGTVGWLIALFVAVRVLALQNVPEEIAGLDGVVSLVVSLAIFLTMALPRWNDRLARRVMATFAFSASAVAAVHWFLSHDFLAVAGSDAIGMALAARGINRNDFGQLLATAATLALLFIRLSRHNGPRRLMWTGLLAFDLAFLVALGSRASLAMVLFALLANVIIERPQYAYWGLAVLAGTVALLPRLLAWIASLGTTAPETLRRGAVLVQALMAGDASQIAVAAGRVSYWQAGLASFADSPVWGVGTGASWLTVLQQTGDYTYAHSTLFILLGESGLVGAFVYYAFCWILASRLSRSVRQESHEERHIAATMLAYEFAIVTMGVFVVAGLGKYVFMLLGLGTALASRRGDEKRWGKGMGVSPTDAKVSRRQLSMQSRGVRAGPERAM